MRKAEWDRVISELLNLDEISQSECSLHYMFALSVDVILPNQIQTPFVNSTSVQSFVTSSSTVKPIRALMVPSFQSTLCFDLENLRKIAETSLAEFRQSPQRLTSDEELGVSAFQRPGRTDSKFHPKTFDLPILRWTSSVSDICICDRSDEGQNSTEKSSSEYQVLARRTFLVCCTSVRREYESIPGLTAVLFEVLKGIQKSLVGITSTAMTELYEQAIHFTRFNRPVLGGEGCEVRTNFNVDKDIIKTRSMAYPILTFPLLNKTVPPPFPGLNDKTWSSRLSPPELCNPLRKLRSFIGVNRLLPLRFWSQESRDMVRKSRWNMHRSFLNVQSTVREKLLDLTEGKSRVESSNVLRPACGTSQESVFDYIRNHWKGSQSQQFLKYYIKRKLSIMMEFQHELMKKLHTTNLIAKVKHNLCQAQDTNVFLHQAYDSIICESRWNSDRHGAALENHGSSNGRLSGENWRNLVGYLSTDGQTGGVLDEFHPDDNTDNGMEDTYETEMKTNDRNSPMGSNWHKTLQASTEAIQLVVPEHMTCSSWSIQIASLGLEMQRAVWFVPPLLSMLPSLIILANSHLSTINRDYRVAVVCVGDERDVKHTYDMFKSCLNDSISIDIASQEHVAGQHENVRELSRNISDAAEGFHAIGRVVIQKNFSVIPASGFSLLVILISAPTLTGSYSTRSEASKLIVEDIAKWRKISSVAIAPANMWTGVQVYTQTAKHIAMQLDITRVAYIAENSDVAVALDAARPGVDIVRAGRDACLLCEIIDREGERYLGAYNEVVEREGKRTATIVFNETKGHCPVQTAPSVRAVNVVFLKTFLGQLEYWDEECEQVARLFDLRQTRAYALYDGFYTAVEYAQRCAELNPSREELWEKILKAAQLIKPDIFQDTSSENVPARLKPLSHGHRQEYRMGVVIQQCLRRAQVAMAKESMAVRRVHGRETFNPIVITSGSEAFCRLKESRLFLEFKDRGINTYKKTATMGMKRKSVAVFHRDDIVQIDESGMVEIATEFIKRLDDFSHVLFLTDDRIDGVPDHALPAKLLLSATGGRTNLTRIIVDENGTLSYLWEREEMIYKRLKLILGATTSRTVPGCAELVVRTSLQRIGDETFLETRQNQTEDAIIASVDTLHRVV